MCVLFSRNYVSSITPCQYVILSLLLWATSSAGIDEYHSIQCNRTVALENFSKLMNQVFKKHAGEIVWEKWSNACASFVDLLL